jgi:hypothetical protein
VGISSDSLVLETYFRAQRADLAAAWAIIIDHWRN